MKRQWLRRPRSMSDHERLILDDRWRFEQQTKFAVASMPIYDNMPRKIRDRAKENTAIIRSYYGLQLNSQAIA